MRLKRAQNAIEFITTYAYVFLIIAIALSVLLLYFSFPKTVIPFQCNFYSGFTCTDVALLNTTNGASFYLLAVDNQPGTINVSKFTVYINGHGTSGPKNGFCIPDQVSAGQYLYCVANYTSANSFNPSQSQIYYGTFTLLANYCVGPSQNLTVISCLNSNTFAYSGSVRLQATGQTALSNTINSLLTNTTFQINYAPITITNNQLVATPAPFQELLAFPSSTYNTYINSAWQNVEFSTLPAGRGGLLESWIEANPSNTAANTMVWVDLPSGLGANTSTTIYVNFLTTNVMSAFGPTGELASLSTTYAKYDNGAYVFDFYDNFNGTTLNPQWTIVTGTAPVNNQLALPASGGAAIASTSTYTPLNRILDVSWNAITYTSGGAYFGFNSLNSPSNNALYWWTHSSSDIAVTANTLGSNTVTANLLTGPEIFSIGMNSIAMIAQQTTIGNELTATTMYKSNVNVYSGASTPIVLGLPGSSAKFIVSFVRLRALPPNNAMPAAVYGTVTRTT